MTCSVCKEKYDIECLNIGEKRFRLMENEHKSKWMCQACKCKQPKLDNQNTPLRGPHASYIEQNTVVENPCDQIEYNHNNAKVHLTPSDRNNITVRKRTMNTLNDTSTSEELSLLGDTIESEKNCTDLLKNLNEVIIQRLKDNNQLIIQELKNTIQSEIKRAVSQLREETKEKTDALAKQTAQINEDLKVINIEIKNLKTENERLKKELIHISTKGIPIKTTCTEINDKKIVLYGFPEYHKEPEYNLHNRLIEFFRDTMNINLMGYIENLYRIGKYTNNNRPLVIELLSKRMAKYILNNVQCLQGSRLFITTFLDDKARKERRLLREEMMKARNKGMYAVIRNNELIIENNNINKITEVRKNHNNRSTSPEPKEYQRMNHSRNEDNHPETSTTAQNHSFRKHRPTL